MEDLHTLGYVVVTIAFVIAMTTIVMRIWVRGICMEHFGLDDWAMAIQLIFMSGQQAILYFFLYYGTGRHITEVEETHPEWLPTLLKGLLAEEFYYVFMQFAIKMCFLLFYFRLSETVLYRQLTWATIIWNTVTTLAIWLLFIFQCRPLAGLWDPAGHPETKCIDKDVIYWIPYSLNLSTDVMIFLLPIRMIIGLQMTLRRRLSILAVLTTGGSAILIGALRAIILNEFAKSPDFTWVLGKLIIVSSLELCFGVVAANMPAMKAFWSCWKEDKLGPGQGVVLSNGSGGNNSKASESSGIALDTRKIAVKSDVRVDLGRSTMLPSESEEALWTSQKVGLSPKSYHTSVEVS